MPFSAVLCYLIITFLHNAKADTGAKFVIIVGFMTNVDRRTTSKNVLKLHRLVPTVTMKFVSVSFSALCEKLYDLFVVSTVL